MRIVPRDSRSVSSLCNRTHSADIKSIIRRFLSFFSFFFVVPSNFNLRCLLAGIMSNGILAVRDWNRKRWTCAIYVDSGWTSVLRESMKNAVALNGHNRTMPDHVASSSRVGGFLFLRTDAVRMRCLPPSMKKRKKERPNSRARAFQPGLWNPRDPIWRGIRSKRPRGTLAWHPTLEPRVHALCWNVPRRCTTGN